jgi:hypothetical protein
MTCRVGRRIQGLGSDLGKRMEAVMRIRRNILAPAILAVGTIGSVVAGPVLALTTSAAPTATAVAVSARPAMAVYGG